MNRAEIADQIRQRQSMPGVWLPGWWVDPGRQCPHDCQRAIYGDEILEARTRSRCLDCGRLLPDLPAKGQRCRHGDLLR